MINQCILLFIIFSVSSVSAMPMIVSENIFVESSTDTDNDGRPDLIFAKISRPASDRKLSTIYSISPYTMGGNSDASNHSVDSDILPQDQRVLKSFGHNFRSKSQSSLDTEDMILPLAAKYAEISADSLGTGRSTGCPTVGDLSEALAAKSVIDWLNGRARAFDGDGREVTADWANGKVGMTGTSYDGTLPIMVATTGVEGLKAIVPIAAISNWYNYYRANGLVVNPGGYVGEDVDVLGYYIVRRGFCKSQLERMAQEMGRKTGDYVPFWQQRNYLPSAKKIKAATFIIHGQSDWNVKQDNATQLWSAIEGIVPRRMLLHAGGHGIGSRRDTVKKVQQWFDRYLEGENNGIDLGPQVEVELNSGILMAQKEWPHEKSEMKRFYFTSDKTLSTTPTEDSILSFVDKGQKVRMESLVSRPDEINDGRVIFLSSPMASEKILSGAPKVSLEIAIKNRKASNITVALVEYDKFGRSNIVTRGWMDPQNYSDLKMGEVLVPGKFYPLNFELVPKQYRISAGSRLGIVVSATDFEYTLRPKSGTVIEFKVSKKSFLELRLF